MRYPRSIAATTRKALALTMVIFCIGAWLAPVAHAQLTGGLLGGDKSGSSDSTSSSGGLLDGVLGGGSSGGGSTDTGSGGSGSGGGGLLGNVVGGLTGTNESPEGSGSGSTSGSGSGGGLIGGVINTVDKTVDKVTKTVGNTVGNTVDDPVGTVDKTVESTVGVVGGTVGSLPVAGETVNKITNTKDRDGRSRSGNKNTSSKGPSVPIEAPVMDTWEVLGKNYAKVAVDTRDVGGEIVLTSSEGSAASIDNSIVSQIARIATEAVQQAAFPLILTMLVIAFLTVQNRIDRKDPKLALAPVDSEQDLLSFS